MTSNYGEKYKMRQKYIYIFFWQNSQNNHLAIFCFPVGMFNFLAPFHITKIIYVDSYGVVLALTQVCLRSLQLLRVWSNTTIEYLFYLFMNALICFQNGICTCTSPSFCFSCCLQSIIFVCKLNFLTMVSEVTLLER